MKKERLLFLIVPLSQLLMLLGVLSGERSLDLWGYGGIALSAAADILLFYVLAWGSGKDRLQRELQESDEIGKAWHIQNERLDAEQKEILMMRAGFEKQLEQIQQRLEKREKTEARQQMGMLQERLDDLQPLDYCQNPVVNAAISEKVKEFQSLGVKTNISLVLPQGLQIEAISLCSLFSNLLDNALEALSELPEKDRKFELNAEIRGGYLFVKAQNPALKEYVARGRRKGRGYGTQILQSLAKRYEGKYQAEYEKGWYTVLVILNVMRKECC